MPFNVRNPRTLVTATLAATVALAGCAPTSLMASRQAIEPPAAVAQGTESVLPAGTFTGLVAAFDGKAFAPVGGARLEVLGTGKVVETDGDGAYTVAGLKAGTYKVAVTKAGFERHEAEVLLSPVAGTPRVNVALNPARSGYGLQQTPITVTVSGVAKDPRGAALPNAVVRFAAAGSGTGQATTTASANAQGFYSVQLTGMVVSQASPAYIYVTASGVSPGGVNLATLAPVGRPLTGASAVLDPSCAAFTLPGAVTFPNGTFVRLTDPNPEAVVEIERASGRADEFYIELTDDLTGQVYGVLANSVADVAGANPPRKLIRFRPPATISGSTFSARYRPFGTSQMTNFGSSYVVNYTQADFDSNLTYGTQALRDWSKSSVETLEGASPTIVVGLLARNPNEGLWVPGETARYQLTFQNSNANVSQDLRLTGAAPVGSRIARVLLTTRRNGVVVANRQALVATTNFSITNATTGAFEVKGFNVPDEEGGSNGEATIEIDFESPASLPPASQFTLNNLIVTMPSAGLTRGAAPGTGGVQGFTDTATSTRGDIVVTAGAGGLTIAKSIVDSAVAGLAEVTLTITPGGSTAAGAFRIQDITGTSMNIEPARATITGTTALAAQGTNVGFQPPEQLVLRVDGVTLAPIVVADNMTLETFCQIVNATTGNQVTARRNPNGSNTFQIVHAQIGSASTIEIDTTTTDSLSTRLGLTEGPGGAAAGADGLIAEFAGNGAGVTMPTTTGWTFSGTTSQHTVVSGAGRVTAGFNILPPSTPLTGPDTFTTPITVRYNIRRTNNAGGHTVGGGAAGFGATINAVNAVTPYTDTLRDLAVGGVNAADTVAVTVN
ncbi:MAG: carboxypeptidase-like regulatory domain-containing protein [Candidatus Sericytochromatia bacterium]|nr:carboxypeptidase-like regulatory domain-containing protein [Candidatus Sericytochromatia bacterium]